MTDEAKKAAHLWVCSCGKHGRVIAADGVCSPEVCSKPFAEFIVQQGVHFKNIKRVEVPDLLAQIRESSLPDTDKETPAEVERAIRTYNEALAFFPNDPLHGTIECIPDFVKSVGDAAKSAILLAEKVRAAKYN